MKKYVFIAIGLLLLAGLYAANTHKRPPEGFKEPPADFKEPPEGFVPPDGIEPPEGFGKGPAFVPDEEEPELDASLVVSAEEKEISNQELTSRETDKSVLLVKNGAKVIVSDSSLNKSDGDSSNGGQSNFYGLNAAIVSQAASTLTLNNVAVSTDADGANAVFSTGEGSVITAKNIKIRTEQNSSRGLDSTYGGVIYAENVDVITQGDHCADFATDRGEGTVSVNGGSAETYGEGSPVIYSTGNILVKNVQGKAARSEMAVIEGKNSITLEKSHLTGGKKTGRETGCGIMLYQSMSGDAFPGVSVFTANDSVLTNTSDGPAFYITNTQSEINLSNTIIENQGDKLLLASGNKSERKWGKTGKNGGSVTLKTENQVLEGQILCDEISKVAVMFGNKTIFKGSLNMDIASKNVNLYLDKNAKVELTADSYLNDFIDADKKFKNITSNGYTLYYNAKSKANSYLKGKSIKLKDGGYIKAY